MKKTIVVLAIIITILSINKEPNKVIIPKESIRFRIIANSNTEEDQKIKKEIVSNLSRELAKSNTTKNIEETRKFIQKELPSFEKIVDKTLASSHQNRTFHINYGKNYFPQKEYDDVVYEAGEYESLVITLGDGKGENFWCVLFPPLCLIDEEKNVEYKSLIKEILDKYF